MLRDARAAMSFGLSLLSGDATQSVRRGRGLAWCSEAVLQKSCEPCRSHC